MDNWISTSETIPHIIVPPSDQAFPIGSNGVFSVAPSGFNLTYQWYFNGEPIALATGTNLTLAGAGETNVGRYWVRVGNAIRTITSQPAALELVLSDTNAPPTNAPGRTANKFFDAAARALVP